MRDLRALLFILALAATVAPQAGAQTVTSSEAVVIVHGAWGGGWDWKAVERELRARGRDVYRATLTGQGERIHLASSDVGLDTHLTDVVNLIVWEQLDEVVLVGHSYGGMVITGVAERIPQRIARLVYLDAMVPFDGECVAAIMDVFEDGCGDVDSFPGQSDGFLPPSWVELGTPPPHDVPHPARTLVEPLTLDGVPGNGRPALYILTRDTPGQPDGFDWAARRAAELGWPVREMVADHNPQRSHPAELVELILESR